jgi:hypothetical protein
MCFSQQIMLLCHCFVDQISLAIGFKNCDDQFFLIWILIENKLSPTLNDWDEP